MGSYGLTFNGTHSNEYGLVMRSENRQLLAAYSKASVKIPGRRGMKNVPNSYDNKFLTIEFGFEYESLEELQALKRKLAKWLSVEGDLVFDDEPDKHYRGRIYNQTDFDQDYAVAGFTVVFEVEPLAYGQAVKIYDNFTEDDHETLITYGGTEEASNVITVKNTGNANIVGFKLLIEQ